MKKNLILLLLVLSGCSYKFDRGMASLDCTILLQNLIADRVLILPKNADREATITEFQQYCISFLEQKYETYE